MTLNISDHEIAVHNQENNLQQGIQPKSPQNPKQENQIQINGQKFDCQTDGTGNPSLEQAVVDKLNKKHAAIHTTQSYILTEKPNPQFPLQTDWFLETRESFRQQYENKKVIIRDGENLRTKTEADVWLKSPQRRTFDGITLDVTALVAAGGQYNTWKGFSVKPERGNCELYKQHIKDNICSGDEAKYEYVLNWMASAVQKPQEIGTALLLMGSQGTGKGVFVTMFGMLFGKHFCHLDNLHHVLGHFNNHLKDGILIFCDEAIWGGNKRDIGRLKAMVTENKKMIEQKGKDPLCMKNYSHFIFASNEDWPVHLDKDDRRFCVLKVGDKRKEDFAYFSAIAEEMKCGGLEALLYELQNKDLSKFNIRQIPQNPDAFSVKLLSASSVDQYLYQALDEGSFDCGNRENCEGWRNEIESRHIYNDYTLWCRDQKISPVSVTAFGIQLKKTLPKTCERGQKSPNLNGYRARVYKFLSLEAVRKEFMATFKEIRWT